MACPYCGSDNLEYEDYEFDFEIWQPVSCNTCGEHWNEVYTFSHNETLNGEIIDENYLKLKKEKEEEKKKMDQETTEIYCIIQKIWVYPDTLNELFMFRTIISSDDENFIIKELTKLNSTREEYQDRTGNETDYVLSSIKFVSQNSKKEIK